MSKFRNLIMSKYLKIPYATSLLPSSLLARGVLSDGVMSKPCKFLALLTYGVETKTRDCPDPLK